MVRLVNLIQFIVLDHNSLQEFTVLDHTSLQFMLFYCFNDKMCSCYLHTWWRHYDVEKSFFGQSLLKIYLDKKIILKVSKVETIDWTVKLQLWLEKVHHHQFIVESFGAFEIGIGNSLPCELVWWQKFDVSICIHILICLVILLATSLLFKDHILWCCTPYYF